MATAFVSTPVCVRSAVATTITAKLEQPFSTRPCHGHVPQLLATPSLSPSSSPLYFGHNFNTSFRLQEKVSISDRTSALQAFRVFSAELAAPKIEKWLLEPIGDGDCSHLDESVPLPEAFELSIDAATVGRVPERVDIVIPIATVSGVHARLEKNGGTLYVTDLDSTNGTYVNDRQLKPGAATPVPPGSRVTFGDDHLAAFKFSKVEVEMLESEPAVEVTISDIQESSSDV